MGYDVNSGYILQLQFEGILAEQQVMTVMTYRLEGSVFEDGNAVMNEVNTIITAGGGLWELWRSCLSEDVHSLIRFMQWIHPVRYAYRTFIPDPAEEGLIASPSLPPNDSQAVTRRAFTTGRSTISTLKLPELPINVVNEGFIGAVQLAALNEFAAQSIAQITLTSGNSLYAVPLSRTDPATAPHLELYYAHNTSRVMHRRTVGRGS